jgi:hypothetical protein
MLHPPIIFVFKHCENGIVECACESQSAVSDNHEPQAPMFIFSNFQNRHPNGRNIALGDVMRVMETYLGLDSDLAFFHSLYSSLYITKNEHSNIDLDSLGGDLLFLSVIDLM